ncbi:MAG: recombination protein O N-terminal domain-containing protein [Patescibacteria group bacterium]
MYAIRTTPGFIIDSRPTGEAGKLLSIFTRDLGLVLATAQGIRFEKSKLRYHTQEYSFGNFSFVKGKEFWRLTSAAEGEGESQNIHTKTQEFFARLALLLRRLLHGEEPHPELFDVLEGSRQFIISSPALTDDQMKTLESLVVLRTLHSLGYIGKDAGLTQYVQSTEITPTLLEEASKSRTLINQHINKAFKESQL